MPHQRASSAGTSGLLAIKHEPKGRLTRRPSQRHGFAPEAEHSGPGAARRCPKPGRRQACPGTSEAAAWPHRFAVSQHGLPAFALHSIAIELVRPSQVLVCGGGEARQGQGGQGGTGKGSVASVASGAAGGGLAGGPRVGRGKRASCTNSGRQKARAVGQRCTFGVEGRGGSGSGLGHGGRRRHAGDATRHLQGKAGSAMQA